MYYNKNSKYFLSNSVNNVDNINFNIFEYSFKLPIHLRYHAPTFGGGYRLIKIPRPSLLIDCTSTDDINTKYDYLEEIISGNCFENSVMKFPCASSSSSTDNLCNWKTLVFNDDINLYNEMVSYIFVFKISHYPIK